MIHDDLPLIDLHRHIDCNVRLSTILDLAQKHGIDLPGKTVEELRPHIQVTEPQADIMAYFQKFQYMVLLPKFLQRPFVLKMGHSYIRLFEHFRTSWAKKINP